MDIYKLLALHDSALTDLADAPSDEARQWAAARADYFGSRVIDLRDRHGVPGHGFDFRQYPTRRAA